MIIILIINIRLVFLFNCLRLYFVLLYFQATLNWNSRSRNEKWLLFIVFVLLIIVITLLLILFPRDSDKGAPHVLHVDPHNLGKCLTYPLVCSNTLHSINNIYSMSIVTDSELPCLTEQCVFAASEIL